MTEQKKTQEYLFNSEYVTIYKEVDKTLVIVENDHRELLVARKESLVKKEESYQYTKAQERADEIRMITAKAEEKLDELADKLVDKAITTLSARMKLNVLFNKDLGNASGWAITVVNELEKLIKDKDKVQEVLKQKESIW